MVHVPIRGVLLLTRAAALVMAAAAVPVVVKQAKPLAKKIGEELEKFGKWLKEDEDSADGKTESAPAPAQAAAKTEAPADAKPGNNGKVVKKPAAKSEAKKPAPKKRTTKAKPKAKKEL